MKKQDQNNRQYSVRMHDDETSTFSRAILLIAIIIYTITLVLLANLAWAETVKDERGALVKVNSKIDGNAFGRLDAKVKSVGGNILAMDIPTSNFGLLNKVTGVCASQLDLKMMENSALNAQITKDKYAAASIIVGILDNTGVLNTSEMNELSKVESASNVGFISYLSKDPNSTVIMRNLRNGESNLVQAMAYMQEYAQTVGRPLLIELMLNGEEMNNPLFVQVCQSMAETGVQFIGAPAQVSNQLTSKAPIQLAFSMFNAETGQLTDRSEFWTLDEIKDQEIMLLGSDQSTCSIHFQNESGFDKVFLSNSSSDIILVTALGLDGELNYYHVKHKETALILRELMNGTPMLEDGLTGIYPFHSKKAVFNGAVSEKQFVALNEGPKVFKHQIEGGMFISLTSSASRTLAMTLDNLDRKVNIQIKDANGIIVYKSEPDERAQRLQTKIDLSQGDAGIYYLDVSSNDGHNTFALMMN